MSTRSAMALICSLVCPIAGGCDKELALVVRDTEGRQFETKCEREACQLLGPGGSHELRATGRLVGVCPSGARDDGQCRALVCRSDAECPPSYGLDGGTCINGLCIEPANEMGTADAVMLCLAGTGLGRDAPKQVERYALALNCGKPCRIPGPCRQP